MRLFVLVSTVVLGLILSARAGENAAKTEHTPEMMAEYRRIMALPEAQRPAAIDAFQKKHGLTPRAPNPEKKSEAAPAAPPKREEPSPEMKAEYLRIKALPEEKRDEAMKEFAEAHPAKEKARGKRRSMQDEYARIMELPEPERAAALRKMHAKYGLHEAEPKKDR
jgi:hypothetical protein